MGESPCLRRSLSQTSEIVHEAKEGDPLRCLRESVSFGRYISESLEWEKWSSFSRKRYLEEAQKFSKPGSVAQKKAHFEAHYKRIAAKQAAALAEEANAAANDAAKCNMRNEIQYTYPMHSETSKSNCSVITNDEVEDIGAPCQLVSSSNAREGCPNVETNGLDCTRVKETKLVKQQHYPSKHSQLVEHMNQLTSVANHDDCISSQEENPPIKESEDQEIFALKGKKEPALSSSKMLTSSRKFNTQFQGKPMTSNQSKKENSATSNSKKAATAEKRRSTTKSLHMSINFDSHTLETKRSITAQKIGGSKEMASVRMSRNSSNALRTSTMASLGNVSKHPSVTPPLGSRRVKTLQESRTPDRKRCSSLFMVRSKNPNECVSKARSPTLSSLFSFRSEERVIKRKEFFEKLAEKNKAKESVEIQRKSKMKAENDLKKLRSSISSKTRTIADSSHRTCSPSNHMKKILLTSPRSPKLGRKPISSTIQEMSSRTPRRPPVMTNGSNHVIEKIRQSPVRVTSLPKMTIRENASLNIQA